MVMQSLPDMVQAYVRDGKEVQVTPVSIDYGAVAEGINTLLGGAVVDHAALATELAQQSNLYSDRTQIGELATIHGSHDSMFEEEFDPGSLKLTGLRRVHTGENEAPYTYGAQVTIDIEPLPGAEEAFQRLVQKAVAASVILSQPEV